MPSEHWNSQRSVGRAVGLRRIAVSYAVNWLNHGKAALSTIAPSRFNSGFLVAGGTGIEPATCGFGVRFLSSPCVASHRRTPEIVRICVAVRRLLSGSVAHA